MSKPKYLFCSEGKHPFTGADYDELEDGQLICNPCMDSLLNKPGWDRSVDLEKSAALKSQRLEEEGDVDESF